MTFSGPEGADKLVFSTTHWTVVLQAGDDWSPHGSAALETLCQTYWSPLYAFIRRKGHTEEDARDLTQQFFAQLLQRNDLRNVDASKGKFRTFLLASLGHFLSNRRDYESAAKRGGGKPVLSFDAMTVAQLRVCEPRSDLSPDKVFDQRWATRLLEVAVEHLKMEMEAGGKSNQFEHLKRYLVEEAADGEYDRIATALEVVRQTVPVLVHRMRQRYRELVRLEVANTVASPLELEEEMRHLFAVLSY